MRDKIIEILSSYEFSIHDEKYLQAEIAEVFKREGVPFKKEVKLSNGIIDFMVEEIGIEIKIKGQPMAIYRQLERYLENNSVKEIILATVKPINLPNTINGKKAKSVSIRGSI